MPSSEGNSNAVAVPSTPNICTRMRNCQSDNPSIESVAPSGGFEDKREKESVVPGPLAYANGKQTAAPVWG